MAAKKKMSSRIDNPGVSEEALGKKMWQAYVQSQPPADRESFRKWEDLVDDGTRRGFLGVARMVLRDLKKSEGPAWL